MKRIEYPICPCCECEVRPARAGFGRFLCPFCHCEYRHNFWHWLVGLSLLGAAGFGMWKVLGRALSAGFALPWQAQLLGTVVGAFLLAWPVIGLIPRYTVSRPGNPPTTPPLPSNSDARPPHSKGHSRTQPLPDTHPLGSD